MLEFSVDSTLSHPSGKEQGLATEINKDERFAQLRKRSLCGQKNVGQAWGCPKRKLADLPTQKLLQISPRFYLELAKSGKSVLRAQKSDLK